MVRGVIVVAAIWLAALRAPASAFTPEEAEWHRAAEPVLTAVSRTAHGEIRFRAGAADEKVNRVSDLVERELARICRRLEVGSDVHYTVLLFDDGAAMRATLKMPEYFGGICAGETLATVFDDDQGTTHELVHLVANVQIGGGASAFLTEGLGDALLKQTHGFPIHALPKAYLAHGRFPPLAEIVNATDLVAWGTAHPQAPHPYNIAASWVRFLLETRGAAKLKQYYRGASVDEVYASSQAALERQWHAALETFELPPGMEAVMATILFDVASPVTLTRGSSVTLNSDAAVPSSAEQAGRTYRWRKNGATLAAETRATLSIEPLGLADGGSYEVTVSDAKGAVLGAKKWMLVVVDPAKWAGKTSVD